MTLNSTAQNPVAANCEIGVDTDCGTEVRTTAPAPGPDARAPRLKVFAFRDMHLQVGDRLQVECPSQMGIGKVFVRVVGYLENTSLIVTTPMFGGQRVNLVENDIVVIRAFSRQSAFAFRSSVLRACRLPFDYLHLSFPEVVHGSIIRKSTRVRTRMAATCLKNGDEPLDAVIENISSTGVLLAAPRSPGARGECVRLEFDAHLHEVVTHMLVDAEIVTVSSETESPGTNTTIRCGLEFRNVQPGDGMVIKGLVYQQIIENPMSIV